LLINTHELICVVEVKTVEHKPPKLYVTREDDILIEAAVVLDATAIQGGL
jgi:hypothetical protein